MKITLTGTELRKLRGIIAEHVDKMYYKDTVAYALEDKINLACKKTYPVEGLLNRHERATKTEEFRYPKKGEYYLSGARPTAHQAPNDLTTNFWIAKIHYPGGVK